MGKMTLRNIFDLCVKSWQYFCMNSISLKSVLNRLYYDIVRFKIEVGIDEKCTQM